MKTFAALYTDEDMSALVATLLRSRGLDVTTVPEQATLGKTDREQLEFATSTKRCILTHNRVDFERLHLQYLEENKQHFGVIIVLQKNAYEVAQRIGILVHALQLKKLQIISSMPKAFGRQEGAIASQGTGTIRAIAGVSKKRRSLLLSERRRSLVLKEKGRSLRKPHVFLGYPQRVTVGSVVMSVVISDEILQASQLTPNEFRQEIALHLFQTGRLTVGYASKLAEMPLNAFRQLLKQRNIPLYSYDVEDLELDLKNLRELGRL